MMIEYSNILVAFISGLVPTLLTLYLNERVKGSVKNSFDKKLEELKKDHSIDILKFQTELNHLKSKENFKFTKLHEERLIVLAQTYQYINENLILLKKCILAIKDDSDEGFALIDEKLLRMEYVNAYKKFLEYFGAKAIYFDEETENLIANYFEEAAGVYLDYNFKQDEIDASVHTKEETNLVSLEAYSVVTFKLKPIKKEIENKFRELLG